ncbi:MAG: tRNA (guanosine(37)-N1)-methyltransferase TrmD [Planctomycetes bacterium]|nr:tRNA (guanosine(37)-N1)-methyltransferase TrmD [Planctomycetota bacterium]
MFDNPSKHLAGILEVHGITDEPSKTLWELGGSGILCGHFPGVPGMLEIHLLTLFPEAVHGYLRSSILGRAQASKRLRVHVLDFRKFSENKHHTVDDRPFGGGPGMVLKPEPIFEAIEWVEREHGPCRKILLTPAGERFSQPKAAEFSQEERLLLLCGRYEGYDERIRQGMDWTEISIGDFVLCGGELPALAIIDAAARLIPGVLGDHQSAVEESFQNPNMLDHPHFTRPASFRGMDVPDVLLSGDHQAIADWRKEQAIQRTHERRPDLLDPED